MSGHRQLAVGLAMLAAPLLAGGGTTGEAQLKVITFAGPQAVVFSPDGHWVAAGTTEGTIKVWDAASGSEIRTIAAHSKFARGLAVSRDGRWLASGGGDTLVKPWPSALMGGNLPLAIKPASSVSGSQTPVVNCMYCRHPGLSIR